MILEKKLLFKYKNFSSEFRTLLEKDVNQEYINGLKHQKEYIENIPSVVSFVSQKIYINKIINSKYDTISGLFMDGELVGTAGVQLSIDKNTNIKFGTIGIFIFNLNYRGIGLGKALVLASTFLHNKITNTKLFVAGMEKSNTPSLKSFLSCGFQKTSEGEINYEVRLNFDQLIKPETISKINLKNFE